MRIGIDAREICGHATGAGRYLSGLLHQWAADEGLRHELILYAPERLDIGLDSRRVATRLIEGDAGTWWEQVRLPGATATDHLDVFFAPAYTAPLRLRVPTVVAIHDLSFVAHPEWFRMREGMRRRVLTRQSARRARAVVTISEFSRRELIDRLGIPGPRVHVIPPGVSAPPDCRGPGAQTGARGARRDDRVLFVGSIFNRRRLPDLVRAFGILARRHPQASLDLVGDNRTHPHENLERAIATEGLEGRIRWHRYVPDDQLRDLYARARAFVFLSEYEGLGMTPLEALAAGIPPLLLDTPVARESCGDAALYVGPGDVSGTADALERILADEPTRSRLLAAAPGALAKYSWPRAARETMALIEEAGGAGRAGRAGGAGG
jgi:glycosyltransferase involved in cell wall biosynthesis